MSSQLKLVLAIAIISAFVQYGHSCVLPPNTTIETEDGRPLPVNCDPKFLERIINASRTSTPEPEVADEPAPVTGPPGPECSAATNCDPAFLARVLNASRTTTAEPPIDVYENGVLTCATPERKYLRHYELKNCIPVYDNQECIRRYDCSAFQQKGIRGDVDDYEVCVHRGANYAIGEDVQTDNPCKVCSCGPNFDLAEELDAEPDFNVTKRLPAAITCASVECPQDFGVPPYPQGAEEFNPEKHANCYYAHDLNKCCASKVICPKDDNQGQLPSCTYNNRTYRYGERIFPEEDNCMTCVCNEHWTDGMSANSTCRRTSCNSSPDDMKKLEMGCIPIYHEKTCCAIDYHCPPPKKQSEKREEICQQDLEPGLCKAHMKRFGYNSRTGKCEEFIYGGCDGNENNFEDREGCEVFCVSKLSTNETVDNSDKCLFGDRYYDIGSRIKTDHTCVTCDCSLPPDFTCVQRTCPNPPNDFCRAHFKPGDCCPTYDCSPQSDCIVTFEHKECEGINCTKYFDDLGCVQCRCSSVCPIPQCAANCTIVTDMITNCQTCGCNGTIDELPANDGLGVLGDDIDEKNHEATEPNVHGLITPL